MITLYNYSDKVSYLDNWCNQFYAIYSIKNSNTMELARKYGNITYLGCIRIQILCSLILYEYAMIEALFSLSKQIFSCLRFCHIKLVCNRVIEKFNWHLKNNSHFKKARRLMFFFLNKWINFTKAHPHLMLQSLYCEIFLINYMGHKSDFIHFDLQNLNFLTTKIVIQNLTKLRIWRIYDMFCGHGCGCVLWMYVL